MHTHRSAIGLMSDKSESARPITKQCIVGEFHSVLTC